jgi:flagellar biosynthesis/type III secretory pathway chaperone
MTRAILSQVLATEIAAVQRFVALLGEEKEILASGKPDDLARIIATKGELADELDAIGAKRQAALAQLGIAGQREAVEAWLATAGDAGLQQSWRALQELARQAKALNERNGQCIALLSRDNQERLAAISGRAPQFSFYGPDGQTPPVTGPRIDDSV